MSEPCDICLAADAMFAYLPVTLCGILSAEVWRCERCGFRQIRPRLDDEELASLYPQEYFDPDSGIGFSAYAREQQRHQREGYFLARRLRRIAPHGRLLDVGCALGFLLAAVRRYAGWDVQGIDVSSFAATFARRMYGLDVRSGTLERAAFPDAAFDFIVQKDLLEHVLRPREHLRETFRILSPGGYVLLVTPNGEANLRPLERAAARAGAGDPGLPLLDQGHLSFFRRAHLLRLFAATGFEVVEMRCVGVQRGLRALGLHPFKRPKERIGPRGRARTAGRAGATPLPPPASRDGGPDRANEERIDQLVAKLRCEIERYRWRGRGSPAYFEFRRGVQRFDAWPARLQCGLDFQCLLRRPLGWR